MTTNVSRWKVETKVSVKFVCFVTLFAFLIARNPIWNMLWDADGYMNSAIIWVSGGPHESVSEQLYYRGFLTSIIFYLPAFLGINYFEPTQFGTYIYVFVMVQNAIIISWMSAYVLPKIVGLFQPINNLTVLTTSLLGFYVMNSFVPYSLMDLWALACLMPVVYLIMCSKACNYSVQSKDASSLHSKEHDKTYGNTIDPSPYALCIFLAQLSHWSCTS